MKPSCRKNSVKGPSDRDGLPAFAGRSLQASGLVMRAAPTSSLVYCL